MIDTQSLCALAAEISQLPGVLRAMPWTRVPIKQRIYVDLKKRNRQHHWDLGAGRRLIVHADGKMEWSGPWAGAMTRDWHKTNGTWDRIEQRVGELIKPDQ